MQHSIVCHNSKNICLSFDSIGIDLYRRSTSSNPYNSMFVIFSKFCDGMVTNVLIVLLFIIQRYNLGGKPIKEPISLIISYRNY